MLIKKHFTFGSGHMSNFPLPKGGLLTDYWVTVELPEGLDKSHREMFVEHFTSRYCPRPMQFAMEYEDNDLNPMFFPGGQLCTITSVGIIDD